MPPRGIQRKLMKNKNRNFVCQKNADSGTIVFRFVISVLVLAKYVTEKGNRDPEFFHLSPSVHTQCRHSARVRLSLRTYLNTNHFIRTQDRVLARKGCPSKGRAVKWALSPYLQRIFLLIHCFPYPNIPLAHASRHLRVVFI